NNYTDQQLAEKILTRLERRWTWTGKNLTCILHEFHNFSIKISPFDDSSYDHFNDIWSYWSFVGASTNKLEVVAADYTGFV
ncbi:16522_t:CDS:2, partial [Gigaspora margarita]